MSRSTGIDAVLARAGEVDDYVAAGNSALEQRQLLRGPSEITSGRTAVIVCMWRRQHRIGSILRMVARQSTPCDLYLWNNDADRTEALVAVVATATECPERVELATSATNIGGFGRFFWARRIAEDYERLVFVDDDEMLDDETVATFLADSAPCRIASAWGFTFTQRFSYWRRQPARVGEPAKYCGTGGMVCDPSIFLDERIFQCRRAWWFCEDIWLSYFASTALGWGLYKSRAEVGLLLDDAAQYAGLHKAKTRMFRALNRSGRWRDPQPGD